MRRLILLAAAVLLCFSASGAKRYQIQYGPWVTNVTETSFTVLWTTAQDNLSAVQVAPDDGSAFEAEQRPFFVQNIAGRNPACKLHCVTVSGLKPGTTYRYRITGREVRDASDPYGIEYRKAGTDITLRYAHTLDPKADSCSFCMVNDMHFNADKYRTLVKGKNHGNTDFLVLNGDIVSYSQSIDSVIKYSFWPGKALLNEVPVVYARGNHESRGADFAKVPALFPTPTGQFYYSFRQGPVAFLVLDGGEDKPDGSAEYSGYAHFDDYRIGELEWLIKAVNEPSFADAPVKVAIVHMPPFGGKGSWYGQRWLHDNILPVLNEAGIDILLGAHHHKYMYLEPGEDGNNFPIVVNSNSERLDFSAGAAGFSVKIFDVEGNRTHSLDFETLKR